MHGLGSSCSEPKWLMFSCSRWKVPAPRSLGGCLYKAQCHLREKMDITGHNKYSVNVNDLPFEVHSTTCIHTVNKASLQTTVPQHFSLPNAEMPTFTYVLLSGGNCSQWGAVAPRQHHPGRSKGEGP